MNNINLNIVLTNAICCSSKLASEVSRLYSIGDRCANSELNKLKLLNDRVNLLGCYKFQSNTIIEFNYIRDTDFITSSSITYYIYINGIQYTLIGDNTTLLQTLVILKLKELGLYIDSIFTKITTNIGIQLFFKYYLPCSVTSLILESVTPQSFPKPPVVKDIIGKLIQQGNCNYDNCITEEQMNNMTHQIMKQCNICDCQLNQG